MIQLKPDECRVLGVLVEKALTTQALYPLTLNALTAGCSQKSNRSPVVEYSQERVLAAIDGLRAHRLAAEAMLSGSRVPKFKHTAREGLQVETAPLVLLAELMLRGPQSLGELRANASRMHPLESLESVQTSLRQLSQRAEPLVEELAPPPGSRATRFVQLLCPGLHPPESATGKAVESATPEPGLAARLDGLEQEVRALRAWAENVTIELGVKPL
jgi:uncharacterized protein